MKIDRTLRLAEQIHRELAKIIIHNVATPLLQRMTIIDAKVAPDLSIVKVYISTLNKNDVKETIKELSEKAPILRHFLAKNLNLRKTPKLYFVYDDSIVRSQELDFLIDAAIARDNKNDSPKE